MYPREPTLRLNRNLGQRLLDALIDAGLKPTTNPPTDQLVGALQGHIDFAEEMARRGG